MVSDRTILDTVEVTLKAKISGFKRGIESIRTLSNSEQTIGKVEFAITELQEVLNTLERLKGEDI
jgi:prefoldin subunit 5